MLLQMLLDMEVMKMKKVYLIPEIEIEMIEEKDIIITSTIMEGLGGPDEKNDAPIDFGTLK